MKIERVYRPHLTALEGTECQLADRKAKKNSRLSYPTVVYAPPAKPHVAFDGLC
jgi:hypothetical protein